MAIGTVSSLVLLPSPSLQVARTQKCTKIIIARKKEEGGSSSGGLGQAPLRMESIEQRQVDRAMRRTERLDDGGNGNGGFSGGGGGGGWGDGENSWPQRYGPPVALAVCGFLVYRGYSQAKKEEEERLRKKSERARRND